MKKKLFHVGLRVKILLVCIAFLLLNSLLTGILCYTYVAKDTLKNFYDSSNDLLSQINTHLSTEIHGISQSVIAMNSNSSIYGTLHKAVSNHDTAAYIALMSNMADTITEFQSSKQFVSSMYIYTSLGDFENFTHFKKQDFSFPDSILGQPFQEDPNLYVAWFPAMDSPIFRDPEVVIPVVYKVRMDDSYGYFGSAYGYFVVSLYQREIQNYLDRTYSSYDYLFIVDANGDEVTKKPDDAEEILTAFQDTDFAGKPSVSKEIDYKGTHYLATYTVMHTNGWQICGLRSQESLTGNLIRFRGLITIILALCCVSSAVLVTLLVRRLTNPLVELARLMDRTTQTQDFTVQASYQGKDEIGTLTDSFNRLLTEIKELIAQLNVHILALQEEKETVRRIQAQKRKAEIKALQAQINPHFLYNTLNAISWQAADQGENEISILATSLGRFFRISLSKGREIISVDEEMEQVSSYLKIQKIRYQDILEYSFYIDEAVRPKKMIKLVVQPLVENSIYHGIKPLDRPGHISIEAKLHTGDFGEEMICITVDDDGAGIEPEKLAELNELLAAGQAEPESGYGIFNVNERIKLYYGKEYGLTLENRTSGGTRATLVFPAQIVEEPDDTTGV